MTDAVFIDCLNNCFIHEAEKYLASKILVFKVLVILDNAPGYPESLQFANPNVEVVFLPPNTTSFLQHIGPGSLCHVQVTLHHPHFQIDPRLDGERPFSDS